MKTKVSISLPIQSSNHFETKIARLLPNLKDVLIHDIGLFSRSGYGQYKDYLYLSVNGFDVKIYKYHTDSMQKDWYCSDEFDNLGKRTKDNFIKQKVLNIIEANINYLGLM